ncbi:DUF2460 domain-containing protein [Henriciella aquimarina]|uniref:DUF2460 domain-containing protein n=1 Tax=Henriciella aquimarina TaxID=545261 RepID=UPI0009FBC555|nr:DUF2460 domain-containing protein [Henriciella aquimarina]
MSEAAFHEVRFPLALGLGASGGPAWQTEIVALASGGEVRNARWAGSRRRWDLASAVSSMADLSRLAAFFEARRGRLHGFRFRDLTDYASAAAGETVSATDQALGTGDGETLSFQLAKTYDGVIRIIRKPVEDTVLVSVDGVTLGNGWSLDATTGQITFETPPPAGAAIAAGFQFDCPVRFDTDHLDLTIDMIGAGRAVSIPIIEII